MDFDGWDHGYVDKVNQIGQLLVAIVLAILIGGGMRFVHRSIGGDVRIAHQSIGMVVDFFVASSHATYCYSCDISNLRGDLSVHGMRIYSFATL
jgi:hypothetical protein